MGLGGGIQVFGGIRSVVEKSYLRVRVRSGRGWEDAKKGTSVLLTPSPPPHPYGRFRILLRTHNMHASIIT